jgi:integral membrane protein (TIGR00529 family)
MYALIAMALSLGLLVTLLRWRVKLGRAMMAAALAMGILLRVTPGIFWRNLVLEWQTQPLARTTGYLWLSLTALVMLVNVLGLAMKETGVSERLGPALQRVLRSRRFALAAIPMIMGLLPTPGGIMLSAPMVRDLGDSLGVARNRQASINFLFRHQWETIWPLFPAVPLIQGMLGVPMGILIAHNLPIFLAGSTGGVIFLLWGALPGRTAGSAVRGDLRRHVFDVAQALGPIVLVAVLSVVFDVPPALGLLLAIVVFLSIHRVPGRRWGALFRAGFEFDFALLILGALLFKVNLEAGQAVAGVVDFFADIHAPTPAVVFLLPFLVAFLTGVTTPTVAMTFPFLLPLIGTGEQSRLGLQTLAFAGVICGLLLTPVHLCLALSAQYFETPLLGIVRALLGPVLLVAAAGMATALWLS